MHRSPIMLALDIYGEYLDITSIRHLLNVHPFTETIGSASASLLVCETSSMVDLRVSHAV